jgi:Zn-dependent M28 family amino/carboxypeptidase
LGRDRSLKGDQIYNGALDNAGGVAQLLEVARAFALGKIKTPRSILFMATTAEEEQLLGARYYVTHPLYPLNRTIANINLDFFNPFGRTHDVVELGFGNTTLDDVTSTTAREQARTVSPDPMAEENFYQRSDQWEFARNGVPALFPSSGLAYIGRPNDYGMKVMRDYLETDYHRVSDDVRR